MRPSRLGALATAALALLPSCGGSGGTGTINVKLVDGPITGYTEVNVNIQKVEIGGDGGWTTLGEPNQTYDLLSLTNGVVATLVDSKGIQAGHYEQLRLVLGDGNTIKLADGSVAELIVPSGLRSGIKLLLDLDVAAGTTRDVVVDFEADHSVQVVQTGSSTKYILRPTIHVVIDFLKTGSISGKLTDGAGAPLAGADVTAQALSDSGLPSVVGHALTGADGGYLLAFLPAGGPYYVVSQPLVGGQSYAAKASPGFTISESSPTATWNASFTAAATGAVSGTVAPPLTGDLVDLLQGLAPGGSGSATFVLRGSVPLLATSGGSTTESYGFSLVPTGSYTVRATRGAVVKTSAVTVNAGATATADFTFP